MVQINAKGDTCPIPVVKTLNAIKAFGAAGGVVETLVDNEIAVQNLTKMAGQKGYGVQSERLGDREFKVTVTVGENAQQPADDEAAECLACDVHKKNIVVAVASDRMGEGDEKLGKTLLKAFLYALSQQEMLPKTILFYNGGAALTCEGSDCLEDLKSLEAQGVELLTCGTCLNFYGLTEKLQLGEVSNMYAIVEKLTQADLVIKP